MADNELVSTNSSNVNKVNTDVHSMTSELQQMALAARSLETSLKGVNNQLTATSKLTGRSLKQMQQYQKTSAKVKVGGQEKTKDRGVLKVVSDLKSAVLPIASLVALVKHGNQVGQQAVNNTKELSEKFNTLGGDLTSFSAYLREATTAAKNRSATNTTADAILDTGKANAREGMFGWVGNLWSGTKKWAAETLAGTNLQSVSYYNAIAQAQNQLMNKGYDTKQLGLLSDAAVTYAWKNASQYSQNTGLDANAVFQTSEFQSEFSRMLGILAGGATDAIFQGYLAESLGDAYIPDVTRSKSVMADYQLGMLTQLANMTLTSQQNKLSEWDNAGTKLQSIGKNLYSFDEVISQNAIEVEDEKAAKILRGMAEDYSHNEEILRSIEGKLGNITGGTGGTDSTSLRDIEKQVAKDAIEKAGLTGDYIKEREDHAKFTSVEAALDYMHKYGATMEQLMVNSDYLTRKDLGKYVGGSGYSIDTGVGSTSYYDWVSDSVKTYAYGGEYGPDKTLVSEWAPWNTGYSPSLTIDADIIRSLNEANPRKSAAERYDSGSDISGGGGGHSFAVGGVGTQRIDGATLFENGPEAVIPLSTPEGINYLANAMKEAGGSGSNINVTVELSGINIADNDRQWNEVARNIGERINTIIRREGSV